MEEQCSKWEKQGALHSRRKAGISTVGSYLGALSQVLLFLSWREMHLHMPWRCLSCLKFPKLNIVVMKILCALSTSCKNAVRLQAFPLAAWWVYSLAKYLGFIWKTCSREHAKHPCSVRGCAAHKPSVAHCSVLSAIPPAPLCSHRAMCRQRNRHPYSSLEIVLITLLVLMTAVTVALLVLHFVTGESSNGKLSSFGTAQEGLLGRREDAGGSGDAQLSDFFLKQKQWYPHQNETVTWWCLISKSFAASSLYKRAPYLHWSMIFAWIWIPAPVLPSSAVVCHFMCMTRPVAMHSDPISPFLHEAVCFFGKPKTALKKNSQAMKHFTETQRRRNLRSKSALLGHFQLHRACCLWAVCLDLQFKLMGCTTVFAIPLPTILCLQAHHQTWGIGWQDLLKGTLRSLLICPILILWRDKILVGEVLMV